MADRIATRSWGQRGRGYAPPGYFLFPFLRCSWCFLFLLASHKVTAISGLSDIHSQLFEGGQRRGPLENGNQSVAGLGRRGGVRAAPCHCLCSAELINTQSNHPELVHKMTQWSFVTNSLYPRCFTETCTHHLTSKIQHIILELYRFGKDLVLSHNSAGLWWKEKTS